MEDREEIIDKEALARRRLRSDKEDNFLQKLAVQEIKDRLKFVKKRFEKILVICGNPYYWRKLSSLSDLNLLLANASLSIISSRSSIGSR